MRKITISILASCVVLFAGCSKDEDATISNKTKTELLTTNGKWYVSTMVSSAPINYLNNGSLVTNLWSVTPACLRDNSFLFQTGGVLIGNHEATKCSSSEPQTENLTWQFYNNEQEIVIDGELLTIVELTATSFVVKDKVAQSTSGVSHFNTITFKH